MGDACAGHWNMIKLYVHQSAAADEQRTPSVWMCEWDIESHFVIGLESRSINKPITLTQNIHIHWHRAICWFPFRIISIWISNFVNLRNAPKQPKSGSVCRCHLPIVITLMLSVGVGIPTVQSFCINEFKIIIWFCICEFVDSILYSVENIIETRCPLELNWCRCNIKLKLSATEFMQSDSIWRYQTHTPCYRHGDKHLPMQSNQNGNGEWEKPEKMFAAL